MKTEKKQRGLAYLNAIRAVLERMYSETIVEDFEANTEAGSIENSLNKIEDRLNE